MDTHFASIGGGSFELRMHYHCKYCVNSLYYSLNDSDVALTRSSY